MTRFMADELDRLRQELGEVRRQVNDGLRRERELKRIIRDLKAMRDRD